MKGNRNKTSYDIKMCVFANCSDPVLREKLILQEQKGVIVEGNTYKRNGGSGQGKVKGFALEKEQGGLFLGAGGRWGVGTGADGMGQ